MRKTVDKNPKNRGKTPRDADYNEVQSRIDALHRNGWSLAAVADEMGVTADTVELWNAGRRHPADIKAVLLSLDRLSKKKRIPKKKRYRPGRFSKS